MLFDKKRVGWQWWCHTLWRHLLQLKHKLKMAIFYTVKVGENKRNTCWISADLSYDSFLLPPGLSLSSSSAEWQRGLEHLQCNLLCGWNPAVHHRSKYQQHIQNSQLLCSHWDLECGEYPSQPMTQLCLETARKIQQASSNTVGGGGVVRITAKLKFIDLQLFAQAFPDSWFLPVYISPSCRSCWED